MPVEPAKMNRPRPKFGKMARITTMIVLTMSYFVVEITVGNITGSIALVADSFHMLSDVVALAVGLAAVRISKMDSRKSTFGWIRAEVLGALVNSVFLLALCFSIFVDSMQRLVTPEEIHNLQLLLIVGSVGLGINIVGLFIFHDHPHGHSHGGGGHSHEGHSHGGHSHEGHSHEGHSHGEHSDEGHPHGGHSHEGHYHDEGHSHCDHSHDSSTEQSAKGVAIVIVEDKIDESGASRGHCNGSSCSEIQSLDSTSHFTSNQHLCTDRPPVVQASAAAVAAAAVTGNRDEHVKNKQGRGKKDHRPKSSDQLNMRGIFLHVLGDALGSVVVIISALLVWLVPDPEGGGINWKPYIDPVLSLVLVGIIIASTIPLLKESALILLQAVTTPLSVHEMRESLEQMEGVLAVHELHVWQLAGSRQVASLHVSILSLEDYVRLSSKIKNYFHDNGVHSVTIQPEFNELQVKKEGRDCALECGPEQSCYMDTCCGKKIIPSATPQLLLQLIEAAEAEEQERESAAATAAAAAEAAAPAGEPGMSASLDIQFPAGSSKNESIFTISTGTESSRI